MDKAPVIPDDDERADVIRKAMTADGIAITESGQVDYFGLDETFKVFLPDKKTWIEHHTLNEGQRRSYLKSVNRDVRIDKVRGDAHLKMSPGEERKALLTIAIVDWNLVRGDGPLPFNSRSLDEFLEKAPPKIIDIIEKDVRLKNGWLQAEMSSDDIKKEMETLNELLEQKLEEESGKSDSGS